MVPPPDVAAGVVLDRINARYFAGKPSNSLSEAGVLVHVLDGGLNGGEPWLPGGAWRDYLSASLFNARKLPHGLYSGGTALVIAPSSKVRCAYPQDSGTKSWTTAKAAKGPHGHPLAGCGPRMCSKADAPFPSPRHDSGYACAFPPQMFKECLEAFDSYSTDVSAYTEVVVDLSVGFAFEAVVGHGSSAVHQAILKHFGLNERQLPLLSFGPGLKGEGPLLQAV